MRGIFIWILLISHALAGFPNNTCNYILDFVEIGDCEDVYGPAINCSGQVFGHLTVMRQLYENLTAYENVYSRKMKFKRMKVAYKMLKILFKEAQRFRDFLKESHNNSEESCVDMLLFEDRVTEMGNYITLFSSFKTWIEYYFPVVAGLEFAFGMFGNLMIVSIFIGNEDMRTGPNQVILNLAISDIFLLITNIVIYYIRYRWLPMKVSPSTCKIMSYTRTVAIAASVYSMMVLSMLRFLVTASTPGTKTKYFTEKLLRIPILLTLVWILSVIVGIPETFDANIFCETGTDVAIKYFKFVCLCLLPLAAIGVFSVGTSRVLHRSAPGEEIPNMLRQRQARERGAKVILCLVVVFCITYLPLNIYSLRKEGFEITDYRNRFLLQLLIPLNSCLNPAALFIGSSKFREVFNRYKFLNCYFTALSFSRSAELEEGVASESSRY